MDAARFDRLAKTLAAAGTRRRALQLLGWGALAALRGGGRSTAAQELGTASCRERLAPCDRREQCCEAQEGHRIGCTQVSDRCFDDAQGERCCGRGGARCSGSCDCCAGFGCEDGECRPIETCRTNTCCECYRCGERRCERLFCSTRLSRRECRRRCRHRNGEAFFVREPGLTWTCRRFGCDVVCPEFQDEPVPEG